MERLEINYIDINKVIPYEKNARHNDGEATDKVAASIKEFGFQQPILVDENNVIVTGHTRLKAARKLGYTQVPIAYAVGMTEEQVNAYRLADNKVAEYSSWDYDILKDELLSISTIDMEEFGFEIEIPRLENQAEDDADEEDFESSLFWDSIKANHQQTTINQYNLQYYDSDRVEGEYDMPIIEGIEHIPEGLQGFNYVLNAPDYSKCVHFYKDDYQFERIWQRPEYYIEKMLSYDSTLTPDFSLYLDMPEAMKVWNIYRSRLIGQIMQDFGMKVIPTVSWAEEESFKYCFDGLPKNATLSISTLGVRRYEDQFQVWKNGVDEMIRRLSPKRLIIYGGEVEYDFGDIETVYFKDKVM